MSDEMMNDQELLNGSWSLIRKDLQLKESLVDLRAIADDELHAFLTERIQDLLDHDFAHLLNSMYRIDLPQNRVEAILNFSEPEKIASELAGAIIEREKLKMMTRLKYSRKKK